MTPPRADADYIPVHLRRFVFHSQDDFYVSRHFDPLLLSHLMYEGFLPIASEFQDQCILLPKLHRQRCLLLFKRDEPEHVPKIVRKRAKKFRFVLNGDFDRVVAGCHEKHGIPWLYPPIVKCFQTLFQAGNEGLELYPGIKVRFFTVELYDVATNALVAGELGYTVGSVYTSLTGFSRANGAGTVQLHALSKFLYLAGFKMWDLGMSMSYKMSLGAKDFERDAFLKLLYKWRSQQILMKLDESKEEGDVGVGVVVKSLFDCSRPPIGTAAKSKDGNGDQQKENIAGNQAGELKDEKDTKDQAMKDTSDEKCEAGAKRKLSLGDRHQGEDKKGKSKADVSPISEADIVVNKNEN